MSKIIPHFPAPHFCCLPCRFWGCAGTPPAWRHRSPGQPTQCLCGATAHAVPRPVWWVPRPDPRPVRATVPLPLPVAKRSPGPAQPPRQGHGEVSRGHGSFRRLMAHGGQGGTRAAVWEQAGKRGHLGMAVHTSARMHGKHGGHPCTDTWPPRSAGQSLAGQRDGDSTAGEGDVTQLSTPEPSLSSLPRSPPPEMASWQTHPS